MAEVVKVELQPCLFQAIVLIDNMLRDICLVLDSIIAFKAVCRCASGLSALFYMPVCVRCSTIAAATAYGLCVQAHRFPAHDMHNNHDMTYSSNVHSKPCLT